MKGIIKNLFVGDDIDCRQSISRMAIIHASKTCHQQGVGYHGNLSSKHPNYLILENGNHLYLNMVDMERKLLPKYTAPIMKASMTFIDKGKILVHCNQGFSRSPSIGLLYLARAGKISKNSYQEAKADFLNKYPSYNPGPGIELYLHKNWNELMIM